MQYPRVCTMHRWNKFRKDLRRLAENSFWRPIGRSESGAEAADELPDSPTEMKPKARWSAAGFAEIRIAVCVKNVTANEIAEGRANEGVGRKVVVCCETRYGHGCGCTVKERLHPPAGIFMSNDRRHGPAKHGMSGRERTVDPMFLPEAAIAGTFARSLAPRDDLKNGINGHCIGQRLQGQQPSFFLVRIVADKAGNPDGAGRSSRSINRGVGNV